MTQARHALAQPRVAVHWFAQALHLRARLSSQAECAPLLGRFEPPAVALAVAVVAVARALVAELALAVGVIVAVEQPAVLAVAARPAAVLGGQGARVLALGPQPQVLQIDHLQVSQSA